MGEPHGPRAVVDDRGGPQLVDFGAVRLDDHAVESPQARGGETSRTRCLGQVGKSAAKRHGERLRHGQLRIPGRRELERVVGASTGQLSEPPELLRGERTTCPLEHELREISLPQPADVDPAHRVSVAISEPRHLMLEPAARRGYEPEARAVEPAERERERPEARRVRPLEIVDRDDRRSSSRQHAKCPERGQSHGRRIDGRDTLAPTQRLLERGPMRLRQLGEHVILDAGEQVVQYGKGERDLCLGGLCDHDPEPAAAGLFDDCRPDRGLADSGLAHQQQPTRALRGTSEEVLRLGDLPLSTDHGNAHVARTPRYLRARVWSRVARRARRV